MNKDFLKQDILDFQTSFYNYLSNEVQNILHHLKQDLNKKLQKEFDRVANTIQCLAQELRNYNKCINELLFDKGEK